MAAGRPPKYDASWMPEAAAAAVAEGKGIAGAAVACDVAKVTIYDWMNEHEEFSYAIKQADARGELAMFDMHKDMAPAAWIFAMKNRAGWVNNDGIELTGKNGGPIQTQSIVSLSDDDLLRIAATAAKRDE